MRRWTSLSTPLPILAVIGTLLGASLSSPFPHNNLCNTVNGQRVPCDPPSAAHALPLPGRDTHRHNKEQLLNLPFPAVQRIHQPERDAVSYVGYKLLRTDVAPSQLPVVDTLDTAEGVDLWSWRRKERSLTFEIDLLTPPAAEPKVKKVFTANNLRYQEVIPDVQDAINKQQKDEHFFVWNRPAHPMTWDKYHSFDEMNQYLDYLAAEYPHLVTLEEIGHSFENRSLRVAKVSTGPNKTAIWIDGGMHAREWIAPATTMFLLRRLVENSWEVPELINSFDWYILPLANPDGYEFSRTKDRLWHKTRSIDPAFPNCVGTDANKNFGFKWAESGSSKLPCSSIYHGPEPFSEPETKAMRDFLLSHSDKVKVYVSIHAYSQMWMTPWSQLNVVSPSKAELEEVGRQVVAAMSNHTGTEYSLGSFKDLLYEASGSSLEFAHGTLGIPYSFALKLRDRGNYGFILPKEQIQPTVEEAFEGIKAMREAVFHQLYPGERYT